MSESRIAKAQRNIMAAFMQNFLNYLLLIVSRVLFVKILDVSYLGINGLFSNVLSILSMADLGMGTVIMYSLYKPIAEKDKRKISALIDFFRKIYLLIAIAVLAIGLAVVPFLDYIIKLEKPIEHLKLYYIVALLNVVVSYLFIYRTTLLVADQKGYILNRYTMVCKVLTFVVQSFVLVLKGNYLLYLIVALIINFFGNVYQNFVALKIYPYLREKTDKLDKKEKERIGKNVKATFLYKICSTIQGNTDNILISFFVGTVFVGYYSNYYMMITAIVSFITLIFSSIKASIGNHIASADIFQEDNLFYYNVLEFINFWMVGFCSIGFICLFQDFIKVFFGMEYTLGFSVVVMMVLNFYTANIRQTIWTFRETTGLFEETKYITAVTAVLNMILSFFLGYFWGMTGIIAATVIARMIYAWWKEPMILFHKFFHKSPRSYYITYIKRLCLCTGICIITFALCQLVPGQNIYVCFVGRVLVCGLISNMSFLLFYFRSSEFQYVWKRILRPILSKLIHR